MPTRFPIDTADGKTIVSASEGFLWAIDRSVGFTRLPPIALAAATLLVPSMRFDDLAPMIKRLAKAARKSPSASLSDLMRDTQGWRVPVEHVVRRPSQLEQHVRAGCRKIRCSVCG